MKAGILLLLAGCGATEQALVSRPATLGDVHYEAPDGWSHEDVGEGGRLVARWAPSNNSDKEVISVIRTEMRADKRTAGPDAMEQMLVDAQRTLPKSHIGSPHQLDTSRGLHAIEIAADFVPQGAHETYRRVHAFVVDGSVLVHVIYTARTNDPDLRAFNLILDSIHRGEG